MSRLLRRSGACRAQHVSDAGDDLGENVRAEFRRCAPCCQEDRIVELDEHARRQSAWPKSASQDTLNRSPAECEGSRRSVG